MDKPMEPKRAVVPVSADLKPVERFLKRYETLTKDFSSRRPDAREQIIEEQIEEYKKKREKVLGNQAAVTYTMNETQKEVQEEEDISIKSNFEKTEEEMIAIKEEDEERETKKEEKMKDKEEKEMKEEEEKSKEEKMEKDVKIEKDQERISDNTEEHSKLSRMKKLEETKRKKESLQKELDESCNEENLEKLAKVLEKTENLQVIEILLLDCYFILFVSLIYFSIIILYHKKVLESLASPVYKILYSHL